MPYTATGGYFSILSTVSWTQKPVGSAHYPADILSLLIGVFYICYMCPLNKQMHQEAVLVINAKLPAKQ